jgi:hypothetical protein
LLGPAVAATARCKNDGKDANPIIATPPLFKKYRLEIFMVLSPTAKPNNLPISLRGLAPLKFRRSEN